MRWNEAGHFVIPTQARILEARQGATGCALSRASTADWLERVGLVCVDGRRALALELATENEQMVVHQATDHVEPQQNAVRSLTDRPHEAAEVKVS